jgi:hypothetical protein
MNANAREIERQNVKSGETLRVDHFIRGKAVAGGAVRYRSRDLGVDFATPEINPASRHVPGSPHDAMFPLQRFVRWMSDEDTC